MAWWRGEHEVARFSCAARGPVSFCANVNKDGSQSDSWGPPGRLETRPRGHPALGLCTLSLPKRAVLCSQTTALCCIGQSLFLTAQGPAREPSRPALGWGPCLCAEVLAHSPLGRCPHCLLLSGEEGKQM